MAHLIFRGNPDSQPPGNIPSRATPTYKKIFSEHSLRRYTATVGPSHNQVTREYSIINIPDTGANLRAVHFYWSDAAVLTKISKI